MKEGHEHLFGFREHLLVLGRSRATVKAYGEHVRSFLEGSGDLRAITRKAIESYIAALEDYRTGAGKPYKPATITLKVRSIKRFFEFLEASNLILINPAETIREPRTEKRRPRDVPTPGEVRMVLAQPNLGTLVGIRDRAILEVLYSTGIRLRELCSLTIHDADLQGQMLRVNQGKGNKDRVVPMGKHAVRSLRQYVAMARPHFTKKHKTERRLFVNRLGNGISAQVVEIMVRTHARAAGVTKQVTPHSFRHGFATALVRNGADITAVQKMLGHARLSTTEIYVRALGLEVKQAHQKTHPREKDREDTAKPRLERVMPRHDR